jgi:hypothetical protein
MSAINTAAVDIVSVGGTVSVTPVEATSGNDGSNAADNSTKCAKSTIYDINAPICARNAEVLQFQFSQSIQM